MPAAGFCCQANLFLVYEIFPRLRRSFFIVKVCFLSWLKQTSTHHSNFKSLFIFLFCLELSNSTQSPLLNYVFYLKCHSHPPKFLPAAAWGLSPYLALSNQIRLSPLARITRVGNELLKHQKHTVSTQKCTWKFTNFIFL